MEISDLLKQGDLVMLNSGGPAMSVHRIVNPDLIFCRWFDDDGEVQRDSFSKPMLVKVTAEPVVL